MPRSKRMSGRIAAAVLALAGFILTLMIFYPGVMTYDAKFVYQDIARQTLGDWQSPAMTVLWSWIDPIAPGSASMFLLIAVLYWLAFGLLGIAVAGRSVWLAVLPPILALAPPAFVFVGIIWRDVLFSVTWLFAAVIAYIASGSGRARLPFQILSFVLCAFGVLLRPNALIAAPILAAYIIWPLEFRWKRVAVTFVPAVIIFFAVVQLVYYGLLGASRQHPLQSIMVFDLGGISHFARENQFPVSWNESEQRLLLNGCYRPTEWDIYWRLEPCQFVMHKLENEEKLFGTPAVTDAWMRAIERHPVAYFEHRADFMWNFLTGSNLTMWVADIEKPSAAVFPDRMAFNAVRAVHDVLKPTPLFRAGTWLLLCVAACGWAFRRRETREGAFAIGACGAAAIYVLTFFAVGVASDFRYAYWAVLACLAAIPVLLNIAAKPQSG
ncbi:MAG TPA: hypothetical protein VJR71_04880 [Pseudolabrys sp.]|nr:hypothetical protein [Pseudolabrys sp.]